MVAIGSQCLNVTDGRNIRVERERPLAGMVPYPVASMHLVIAAWAVTAAIFIVIINEIIK